MFNKIFNIGLLTLVLVNNVNAKNWTDCASEVCSNMGISASSAYDCWDKLAGKYNGKSGGGGGIFTPMCNVAESIAKNEMVGDHKSVGNCSAAIAKSMGIYLSSGSIGESMCKIADKVKSTKSLK
jgi:hypothetical protein